MAEGGRGMVGGKGRRMVGREGKERNRGWGDKGRGE